jgi:PKD repeat protein
LSSSFSPSTAANWCHGTSTVSCPSIDLNAYSGMSGIRVKFEAVNGYSNNLYLDNINITGQASVAPVASVSGDSAACTGQAIQFYDLSTPSSNSRLWTFQGGTPSTSTLANPQVSYAAAGSYDVKLVVSNAAGADSVTLANFVNIISAPVADVTLAVNSTTVCKNDSVFATATPTNGGAAPTYDWLVNGTVVSSVSSSFAGVFQDGDVLKVRMVSSDDCVNTKLVEDSVIFTVNNLPATSLGAQGYVCELDGPKVLTGGLPAGGLYSGTGVVNDTLFPSVAGTGSHWIYYTYTDPITGCSNEKKRAISVQAAPGKPSVTQNATTGELEAVTPPGTYTYQWLDANMDPISGATAATFMPTSNGDYFLQILSNIQCSNFSDAYTVANIGLNEENLSGFEMFPNPATTRLNFTVQGSAEVRIMDAAGRLVLTRSISGEQSVDVAQWARGVYMIQVIHGEASTTTPVVLK